MSSSGELTFAAINGPTPRVAQPQARVLKANPSKELDPEKTNIWVECSQKGLKIEAHEEYVSTYKSYIDQRQYLVHRLTCERIVLPAGIRWGLSYDDGGFGGVFDEDRAAYGGDAFLLENLFKQTLCKNTAGALQVYDQSRPRKSVWDVETRQKQFIVFDVSVKVGSMENLMSMFATRWPWIEMASVFFGAMDSSTLLFRCSHTGAWPASGSMSPVHNGGSNVSVLGSMASMCCQAGAPVQSQGKHSHQGHVFLPQLCCLSQ